MLIHFVNLIFIGIQLGSQTSVQPERNKNETITYVPKQMSTDSVYRDQVGNRGWILIDEIINQKFIVERSHMLFVGTPPY